MEVTSHFIGVKIKSKSLVGLFIRLQQYLKENKLEQVIELQDIHSLHISLYYLEKDILPEEQTAIDQTIANINQINKDFVVILNQISYFKKGEEYSLGYIAYSQVNELQKLNKVFANKFKKDKIIDNQYTYIPHTSLFRILNNQVFKKYKKNIDSLINKELKQIKNENLLQGVFLFAANSNFHPEIQFSI